MSGSIRVAELFAGVGGFRLGLEGYDDPAHPEFAMPAAGPFTTVWADQWEPDGQGKKQFAWRCYETRFGEGSCVNEDIKVALDQVESGERTIPDFDMLVGGFPCQDYSVARPLSQAGGIEGKKGVLWWQIRRLLSMRHPRLVLLENVDRLITSPAKQRGRDFAVILSCFTALGYRVEWRIINAADYGMPQKRRRTYIYAQSAAGEAWDARDRLTGTGVIARAFPVNAETSSRWDEFDIPSDPYQTSEKFGVGLKSTPFQNAGIMQDGHVTTARVEPYYTGPRMALRDILVPDDEVPDAYYVPDEQIPRWEYLKGAKKEARTAANGHEYMYSEGGMSFPDDPDKPARTILTGDGGSGPSRTKHIVRAGNGRLRRLTPDELDQVQMFPKGWTDTGMTDMNRAFCMGNALVTGIPHRIGQVIAADEAAHDTDE